MIIESLLDNDLYKFTMMQAVYHQFPDATVEYEFKCRSGEDLTSYADEIRKEINHLGHLVFASSEIEYLETLPYIKKDFVEFLRYFGLSPKENVTVTVTVEDSLKIIVKGSWLNTILFEVPILAIVNEVYFRNKIKDPDYIEASGKLIDKILIANREQFMFGEFGTHRRFSRKWQEKVTKNLKRNCSTFMGTSNVYLAMKYDIKPIGTQAHEWAMAGQALAPSLEESQSFMLQKWQDEYRGQLGIALTDTITTDAFLKDFDLYFAKLYDGVRQDSGDCHDFGYKMIEHYNKLNIDPKTKTIVFSDNLNFNKMLTLDSVFKHSINVMFGIGTNLTNDFTDVTPLSIVMKMQKCNGRFVAKISDEPEKAQCQSEEYLKLLKNRFGVE
jgi:nicotinate phosphoribosyltransferase